MERIAVNYHYEIEKMLIGIMKNTSFEKYISYFTMNDNEDIEEAIFNALSKGKTIIVVQFLY